LPNVEAETSLDGGCVVCLLGIVKGHNFTLTTLTRKIVLWIHVLPLSAARIQLFRHTRTVRLSEEGVIVVTISTVCSQNGLTAH
jgi:hypothetical protein